MSPMSPTFPGYQQQQPMAMNGPPATSPSFQAQQLQQQQQQQQPPQQISGAPGPAGGPAGASGPTPQLFWVQQRILGANPFPRTQHSSSVTTAGTDIFVFGGNQRGAPKGDLHILDSVSLQCQAVSPAGADPPMPKCGHTAVSIGQYILYFGGWDTTSGQCDDSLHVLHTVRREWNKPVIQGTLPTSRHSHSGCSIGTVMYIFGGQVDNHYLGDIVSFDMKSITQNAHWDFIVPQSDSPPARAGHCAAVYDSKIYIFGGADADYFYNDMWCFDPRINVWTPIPASGYLPTGRYNHSCTIVDGVFYVFGGNSPDGSDLNDAYAFRINERRWYLFQCVGPLPSPRNGHALCTIKDKIFLVGGDSEKGLMEDPALVHVLEIPKIRLPESGQVIPPRQASSASSWPSDGAVQPYSTTPSEGSVDFDPDRSSSGSQQTLGRPDRPVRPDRVTQQQQQQQQRPGSPATFGVGTGAEKSISQQIGQRSTMGVPPRGASVAQNLSVQDQQGYGGAPAVASTPPNSSGSGRRTMQQPSGGESPSLSNRSLAAGPPGRVANLMSPGAPTSNRREDEINPFDVAASYVPPPPGSSGARPSPPSSDQITVPSASANRSPSPASMRAHSRATPPLDQGGDKLEQLQRQMRDRDEELMQMRRREAWLVTEVMMARQMAGDQPQLDAQQRAQLSEKRMSMEDLEKEIENRQLEGQQLKLAQALLKVKEELRTAKMSIATQAQAASLKIKEAERIRTGALQEAAYLKAKLSSMANAQQDPSALARVETERAADLEKRLTLALSEMEALEAQYAKVQEGLQQEKLARLSAEERSNGASVLAEQAQAAHTRALAELSTLHGRATKAEEEVREYATQLAESQAGFSGHQSQSTGLLQKVTELKQQIEERDTALERIQRAYTVANDRAMRAEALADESSGKLSKLEGQRAELSNEVTRYKGETERLQSKVEELDGRWQISKDEVVTLRKLVEDGLGAFNPRGKVQQSVERKHDSIAILNTVSKVSELEHELSSLKVLHKNTQASASKSASELADAMIEVSRLEQSSMKAQAESISLHRQLAEERKANGELRSELGKTEQELENRIKELENNEVQLGMLKDVMREKGIMAEAAMVSGNGRRGSDGPAMETKVRQAEERARALEQELEETREHFTEQMGTFEAQRQVTVQHAEKANVLLRKLKKEKEDLEAQLENMNQNSIGKRQGDERIQMLQQHWDEERRELTTQLTQIQGRLADSEAHTGELSQKVTSLTERVEEVQTLNEAVSEQLETTQEQAEKFRTKASTLEMQLKSDAERLVKEIHDKQREVDQLRSQVGGGGGGGNPDLEQRLKKAQETIQILEGDNSVLEARLQDSEKKVALLLDDMQHSTMDNVSNATSSPLNSSNLSGVHQQLSRTMGGQGSPHQGPSPSARNGGSPRMPPSSRNGTNARAAAAAAAVMGAGPSGSPSGMQGQPYKSPSPGHQYGNDDDLYNYNAGGGNNPHQYANGAEGDRDSMDSITRELEMLKVPWNKNGGSPPGPGQSVSPDGGRKSTSPLQHAYPQQQQQRQPYGNGGGNRYMYNEGDVEEDDNGGYLAQLRQQRTSPSQQPPRQHQQQQYGNSNGAGNRYMYSEGGQHDDDDEEGVSYLAHLRQRPSPQQQQQQPRNANTTTDTHSFNDRSPSRLKEYEQMIDEIENARKMHQM
ncbi:Negative regulator of mitotic exit [Mortierella sp. GBA43]|nr:Negative regulator of mitotic exit [Mortierella sp. GBA43]